MSEVDKFVSDLTVTQYELDLYGNDVRLEGDVSTVRALVRGRSVDGVLISSGQLLIVSLLPQEEKDIRLALQPALDRLTLELKATGLTEWVPPPELEAPPI